MTHDRCMGAAVAALCEGISSVTGKPFPRPYKGALDVVLAAFDAHFPDLSSRVERARESGATYATQETGKVNVLRWADFLNTPDRPSGGRKALQPAPSGKPAFEIGVSAEDEERIRKETEALGRRTK
ncbi:MAG TPA: hypothetical protein VKU41_20190 [Polyangiaceae bacterium]|nr:hypothetical protein [Polyangiaceae bacterium]